MLYRDTDETEVLVNTVQSSAVEGGESSKQQDVDDFCNTVHANISV